MAKYVQTNLSSQTYKNLRWIAIQRETSLNDLVRDVVSDWVNEEIKKEEFQHGSEEDGEKH